jgi:ElaB/YqjD/DUF883 family membrane-anchored ribosome-binding protein
VRDNLKGELDSLDTSLSDLGQRLLSARDAVKADVHQQFTALQKRDDDLKAQLREAGARADVEADKARHEIHRAVVDMKSEIQRLSDRLVH